ncbi:MAG: alpha/beta fold hydrolase [Planctomycetes bacterium]|nr:alpha/beta fold hydrolase [Planctomycetota bacterium]
MPETPGYFPASDGTPLYGVYHAPDAPAKIPVLVAPSLFEERKSAYAALTSLARALATDGHPVLRFDYRGSGESGGDSGVRRWPDLAADLAAARQALAKQCGADAVALVGLRLGATLCLLEGAKLNAKAVVALAPVIKGAAQARLWRLRSKIRAEMTQGEGQPSSGESQVASRPASARQSSPEALAPRPDVLDFEGLAVAPGFFDEVAALDLSTAPAIAVPSLLVQISHRTDAAPESEQLAKSLGAQCKLTALRLEPFWDRVDDVNTKDLEQAVIGFLKAF